MIKRHLTPHISDALSEKIVLLSGPRQVGKTTISKSLRKSYDYINYDDASDRNIIAEKSWDRDKALLIFDEIHKMTEWKRFLKGVYDKEGITPNMLVTGSARMDTFRKVGDSLAGRYFRFRLHPLDLKELCLDSPSIDKTATLDTLLQLGGFPEPFSKGSEKAYKIWRKTHQDIILRQDLIDLENVSSIQAIETLIQLLRERVGTTVSYLSLARDLQVSHNTVKRWIEILENLFIIFRVTPYHRNITRSILKEPKYYFYDTGAVIGDEGARFENYIAGALLKELHYKEDTEGIDFGLHYLKDTTGAEVDFLITIDAHPKLMLEAKLSDTNLSKQLIKFEKYFDNLPKIQLVKNAKRQHTFPNGAKITPAADWLSNLPF